MSSWLSIRSQMRLTSRSGRQSLLVHHISQDIFVVPLTSRTANLLVGEFLMKHWKEAGLNVASAVKRGLFTIHQRLVIKKTGSVSQQGADELERSLRTWLGL
jgi:mRNA interferase MazF